MLARFDHRPMLTAALALATIVLLVVVVTLSTLLITAAPPAAPALSGSVGQNPPLMGAGGENHGEGNNYGLEGPIPQPAETGNGADSGNYGEGNNYGLEGPIPQPAKTGNGADSAIDRHAEVVAAYNR